ncbi:hypothetical protein GQR58_030018 [Nymphon striatum]|nr:hypothetical protein GQR58_030018 [Nymphon striatum]
MCYDDIIRVADLKTRKQRFERIHNEMNSADKPVQLTERLNKGRRVRTHRVGSFALLYVIGGLRWTRRRSLRHKIEQDHLQNWLTLCLETAQSDPECAVELLKCRRLVKGYSDTHTRGLSKFARVMEASTLLKGRSDAAQWIARLREAALQDENGDTLDGPGRPVHKAEPPSTAQGIPLNFTWLCPALMIGPPTWGLGPGAILGTDMHHAENGERFAAHGVAFL